MLFHSAEFLFIFLPVVLAGFYLVARFSHRAAILFLFLASLFFYGWWNPVYVGLILGSIVFNYVIGVKIEDAPGGSRSLLALGVAGNLALLGFFKYAMFFVDNVNFIAGTSWDIGTIVLPLAISFFTFQQIAWLADAHKGRAYERNFVNYCLFVTFFPQLIAGPIVHHREMMPQFDRFAQRRPDAARFAVGLTILAIGLFKKVVIADTLDMYATPLFDQAETGAPMHFLLAWGAVLAYTLQIYFDFSGYTDMATGIARMFGIRLPLNFYSPYKAVNIVDFWRRWHITLSRFLRDYLYIPLGGNRKGKPRRYANLMITMLLGGLWHGASWNFVIWGGLHGLYLCINHAWIRFGFVRLRPAFAQGLTFLAVVFAWVFFRAESFDGAMHILHAMVAIDGEALRSIPRFISGEASQATVMYGDRFAENLLPLIAGLLAMVFILPNTAELMRMYRPYIGRAPRGTGRRDRGFIWRPNLLWALLCCPLVIWGVWTVIYEPSKVFLYFQF